MSTARPTTSISQLFSAAAVSSFLVAPAAAQPSEAQVLLNIPAGSLSAALTSYAEQAGVQLLYPPQIAAGRHASALRGRFGARDALTRLLAGTGIAVRQVEPRVFVLSVATADPSSLRASEEADRSRRTGGEAEIVVTGTHIHGAAPVAPTKVISRDEMQRNGYNSVAQALQALPGNFGGMATEQSALSAADRSGTNSTLGSGVNLRGLGPDATLVLINGRRVAGSGLVGDFADLSSIPLGAVDRVEVVTDGASALYGSDAVAGVVNILLKQDFTGRESYARAGTVTKGHAHELQLAQTGGAGWEGGSLLVSYEFSRRWALRSADRRFAASADSRPFGGTDHRYPYSSPGNVLGFDANGSLVPAYAIPSGQNGRNLSPGDFLPGVTNLEDFRAGTGLTPDQRRHSLYAHVSHELFEGIAFSLEGRFADRKFDSRTSGYATILSITDTNPWFVSPTRASSDLIGFAFTRELGATHTKGSARTLSLTGALDAELGAGWRLASYAAFARQRDTSRTDQFANEYILSEALGSLSDDPASAYSPAADGYFNPYGDGTANAQTILDAISGYTPIRTRSTILTADALADGPLFEAPGGSAKLAVGINYRRERFTSQSDDFVFTPVPNIGAPARYGRSIWAGYAEFALPLVGGSNAMPGIEQLELTAAVRSEHYADFGGTTNPKIALRWAPVEGLALRTAWGTSFRAPNLRELGQLSVVSPAVLRNARGSSVVVLQRSGGNPNLTSERAHSWTSGFDIAPAALAGFTAHLTAFRTVFDHRIDQPALRGFSRALTDPSLAPFVQLVTPANNEADRALVADLLAQAGGVGAYPVETIAAVVDTRYVNTGRVEVAGFDAELGYAFEVGSNRFNLGLSATWLARWRERLTPTSITLDQRNVAGRPVDWRGRMMAGWTRGALDALFGVNYVDRYRDLTGGRISSWTTVDLRVAYAPEQGPLAGTSIALVGQNLFDRSPPFFDSTAGVGYDGANADATGRFVALEIAKRW